ncbi:unnamed protein product [Caenorhabditis sp. 36 PRJEB53466]|nr:unnamed protein product [Caenorhabditis sp. 36 PRJEB53466]
MILPQIAVICVLLLVETARANYIVVADGRLLCHGEPLANQTVRLYEKTLLGSDRVLGQQSTDFDGEFYIAGNASTDGFLMKTKSFLGLQGKPYLFIEHNCTRKYRVEDVELECTGFVRRIIPDLFVSDLNAKDHYLYDMGTVELSDDHSISDQMGVDFITDNLRRAAKCEKIG